MSQKLAQEDNERAKHFLKLKDFQDRNDAKHQALGNGYPIQRNFQEIAKKDEETMLKEMARRDFREEQKNILQKELVAKNKIDANLALRIQMKEK